MMIVRGMKERQIMMVSRVSMLAMVVMMVMIHRPTIKHDHPATPQTP